jgi:hypothetical protein
MTEEQDEVAYHKRLQEAAERQLSAAEPLFDSSTTRFGVVVTLLTAVLVVAIWIAMKIA